MFEIDLSAYLASFLAIASIHIAAVMSPGPDVALTIRNSLLHSRKVGLAGALGTTTGIFIHLTYTVFGIGYLVVNMPWLMNTIRIAGAFYLLYLGYQSFKSTRKPIRKPISDDFDKEKGAVPTLSAFKAYRIGILNNLLNPVVILLFISILSAYITPETPSLVVGLYGFIMIVLTLSWFSFVALFFSIDKIRLQFLKMGHWLELIAGTVLILFAFKVFYLTAKAF